MSHVRKTIDLHMIKTEEVHSINFDEDDDLSFQGQSGEGSIKRYKYPALVRTAIGAGVFKVKASKSDMAWKKEGVALTGHRRKKRKHYPHTWGMSAGKIRMKKRMLHIHEGDRRYRNTICWCTLGLWSG